MNEHPNFSKSAIKAATAPAYFSARDLHAFCGDGYIVQGVNLEGGQVVYDGTAQEVLDEEGSRSEYLAI